MKALSRLAIIAVVYFGICCLAYAGDVPPPVPAAAPNQAVPLGFRERVELHWQSTLDAIRDKNLQRVNAEVHALETLRMEAGVEGFDEYSLGLLEISKNRLLDGNIEETSFFLRKALQLSPNSSRVLISSLGVARATHTGSSSEMLFHAVGRIWHEPAMLFGLIKRLMYPAAWALTIGIYLSMLFVFCGSMKDILRAIALAFPPNWRGYAAPVLATIILGTPVFLGPLWCVAVWSVVIVLTMPKLRWMSILGGLVLVTWGSFIPIRENFARWLEDPGIKESLSVYAGSYGIGSDATIQHLENVRPDDGFAMYMAGVILRQRGEYDRADKAFLRAELLWGEQPWTKAAQGLVAYMRGNIARADELFQAAEVQGMSSAEFYYNFSKIKFEALDTAASKDYLLKADRKDSIVVELLRGREERLDEGGLKAISEMPIPFTKVLWSGLIPVGEASGSIDDVAGRIVPGVPPPAILIVGVALIIFALIRPEFKRKVRFANYYEAYRPNGIIRIIAKIIPGGSWLLLGRAGRGAVVLTVFVGLLFPLIGWPIESREIVASMPGVLPMYGMLVAALAFIVLVASPPLFEES
jgi:tetratricopeptide (TPR) repeat protein